jgi:hypothetical protein
MNRHKGENFMSHTEIVVDVNDLSRIEIAGCAKCPGTTISYDVAVTGQIVPTECPSCRGDLYQGTIKAIEAYARFFQAARDDKNATLQFRIKE